MFERARQLVRWHYQWLVVHDYLKTVTLAGVVDKVLLGGNKHYEPATASCTCRWSSRSPPTASATPWSAAVYDYNRNFGRPGRQRAAERVVRQLLFLVHRQRTPGRSGGDTHVLPFNWIIEWDRFVDKGARVPDHFARKIDTAGAAAAGLINQGNDPSLPRGQRRSSSAWPAAICCAATCWPSRPGRPSRRRWACPVELEGAALGQHPGGQPGAARRRLPRAHAALVLRAQGGRGARQRQLAGRARAAASCARRSSAAPRRPRLLPQPEGGWSPEQGVRLPNGDPIVTSVTSWVRHRPHLRALDAGSLQRGS